MEIRVILGESNNHDMGRGGGGKGREEEEETENSRCFSDLGTPQILIEAENWRLIFPACVCKVPGSVDDGRRIGLWCMVSVSPAMCLYDPVSVPLPNPGPGE